MAEEERRKKSEFHLSFIGLYKQCSRDGDKTFLIVVFLNYLTVML